LNIVVHCQVYWPDNSAVSQMISAVAEDAAKAGHAVTVVASARGYNLSETYPRAEAHNGVAITRVRGLSLNRHSVVGRVFNYLTFILCSSVRVLSLPKPDCLIVTSVPPLSLGLGVLLNWLKKVPFVYVIEDLYPDIVFASGLLKRESCSGRFLNRAFGWMMSKASATIVLGDYMKQRLTISHPRLAPAYIYPIHNWQDETMLYPLERVIARGQPLIFQYSGNFGEAHDFKTILGAAKRLGKDGRIRFEFIGGGKRREFVEREILEGKLLQCQVRDYVPQAELNNSLNQADAGLVTLANGYEGLIVPSKIYGIMAVGRPVLYVGPLQGEVPDLIRQHSLGWMVRPGDEDGLVKAILEAVERPELRMACGANGRRAFKTYYERKIATAKYLKVFEDCCQRGI
jgi:glycosyltransferase involved in cell wall biosynthesis